MKTVSEMSLTELRERLRGLRESLTQLDRHYGGIGSGDHMQRLAHMSLNDSIAEVREAISLAVEKHRFRVWIKDREGVCRVVGGRPTLDAAVELAAARPEREVWVNNGYTIVWKSPGLNVPSDEE